MAADGNEEATYRQRTPTYRLTIKFKKTNESSAKRNQWSLRLSFTVGRQRNLRFRRRSPTPPVEAECPCSRIRLAATQISFSNYSAENFGNKSPPGRRGSTVVSSRSQLDPSVTSAWYSLWVSMKNRHSLISLTPTFEMEKKKRKACSL